jgi:hypothetical protein
MYCVRGTQLKDFYALRLMCQFITVHCLLIFDQIQGCVRLPELPGQHHAATVLHCRDSAEERYAMAMEATPCGTQATACVYMLLLACSGSTGACRQHNFGTVSNSLASQSSCACSNE